MYIFSIDVSTYVYIYIYIYMYIYIYVYTSCTQSITEILSRQLFVRACVRPGLILNCCQGEPVHSCGCIAHSCFDILTPPGCLADGPRPVKRRRDELSLL